jgi:hypothetical protein
MGNIKAHIGNGSWVHLGSDHCFKLVVACWEMYLSYFIEKAFQFFLSLRLNLLERWSQTYSINTFKFGSATPVSLDLLSKVITKNL